MRNCPLKRYIKDVLSAHYGNYRWPHAMHGMKIGKIKWNNNKSGIYATINNRQNLIPLDKLIHEFGADKFKLDILIARQRAEINKHVRHLKDEKSTFVKSGNA